MMDKKDAYWAHEHRRRKKKDLSRDDEAFFEKLQDGFDLTSDDDFEENKDMDMLTEDDS